MRRYEIIKGGGGGGGFRSILLSDSPPTGKNRAPSRAKLGMVLKEMATLSPPRSPPGDSDASRDSAVALSVGKVADWWPRGGGLVAPRRLESDKNLSKSSRLFRKFTEIYRKS